MRKFLIALIIFLTTAGYAYAAKLPDNVKNMVNQSFPNTNFRFDGVIILPDNTIYLPVIPARILNPETLEIAETIPKNKKISDKPDVIIFNNDYVLLKVTDLPDGRKGIAKLQTPPHQIKSGLLPQDMLVPRGLVIPENMQGIIGNLQITTVHDPTLKVVPSSGKNTVVNSLSLIPQLANKTIYATTNMSKNIQVVNPSKQTPEYALSQDNIPISVKGYDGKFLLVTSYNKKSVDIISLADEQIIKQIELKTQPDEIIIDSKNKIAYIAAPSDASIYVLSLDTMTLKRQLKLNGMCEKLTLSEDGSKIFYVDKKTNEIWAVELNNKYLLKEIGRFPNTSKIAYSNGKIYITSRTKNRLAIIDYATTGLVGETDITQKPVDMLVYKGLLYILGAVNNEICVIDTETDQLTDVIKLGTNGFSTKIFRIDNTDLAIVTDTQTKKYTIVDLANKKVIKSNSVEIPINSIVVVDKVKKINK